MTHDEFDWIDDAFEEGAVPHQVPKSAGRQVAGCLGAAVFLAVVFAGVLFAACVGLFTGASLLDYAMR